MAERNRLSAPLHRALTIFESMTDASPSTAQAPADGKANIGVTGLAVMGSNIARNFARNGFTVALHNRSIAKTDALLEAHGDEGTFVRTESIAEFADALATPRCALIMVQAGAATDSVIDELASAFDEGDIIIDGGNALYTDTIRREKEMAERGIRFIGAGISGGEEGALEGPSIMPGGPVSSYEVVGPILEKISAHVDGQPCCTHIGEDGSGHFVKMVHNGIEYSDMQLIGEAYHLLREVGGLEPAALAEVFREWNEGDLDSYLIEITAEVLAQVDERSGSPLVDVIVDQAGQKGTGRWTVKAALDLGVPVTGIAEAVFARALSSSLPQREAGKSLPSGATNVPLDTGDDFVEDVRKALYASKIIAYAQGFDQINAAKDEYGWDIHRGDLATIWRGGCIIRAKFLNRIVDAYEENPELRSLVEAPYFLSALTDCIDSWRRVAATAVHAGIPAPGFASSLAYYDALRTDRLPAALTQGLRDYFGAHNYRRTDAEGSFHTLWSGDRSEVEA
jgi:6-phosphogluconate dehydrogenase